MTDKRNTLAAVLALLLTRPPGYCQSMPRSHTEGVTGFDLKTWCREHRIRHSISHRTVTFKVKAPTA